jgi:hypothetical protein
MLPRTRKADRSYEAAAVMPCAGGLPHLREHGWRSPASSTHCYKCFCHAQRGEGDDGDEEKDEEGPELDSSGDEIQMPVKRRRP